MAMHGGSKALVLCTLALTLALAGCGRRGALEDPGRAAGPNPPAAEDVEQPNGMEVPAGEMPERKRFFLDFLI
jgi:predicted small lipoprotein YifL